MGARSGYKRTKRTRRDTIMTAEHSLPTGTDLLAEIDRLRKDRNAVILAHYYQSPQI